MSEEQISKWEKGWSKWIKNKKPRIERRKANVERRALETKQRRRREQLRREEKQTQKQIQCEKVEDLKKKKRKFSRNQHLILNYGITLKQYQELFEKQKGCCAICGRHQRNFKSKLHVDHDHKTGIIRGLLCTGCNIILGHYEKHKDQYKYYLVQVKYHGIKPKF